MFLRHWQADIVMVISPRNGDRDVSPTVILVVRDPGDGFVGITTRTPSRGDTIRTPRNVCISVGFTMYSYIVH